MSDYSPKVKRVLRPLQGTLTAFTPLKGMALGVSQLALGAEAMTGQRDLFIVMNWSSESCVSESGELDDLIYETSGDLFNIGDKDEREFVGKFRLYYVDVERAVNEGMPVFDMLDAHAHTVEYYEPIFGSNAPEFSDRLTKLLHHDVLGSNLLILDRLEILPEYRGKELGLSVMRHMMRRFSAGAAVVAIKPYPLQFEAGPSGEDEKKWRADFGLGQLPRDKRLATKTLCDYYSKLGFVRISRTPFMVRATAWPVPSGETV